MKRSAALLLEDADVQGRRLPAHDDDRFVVELERREHAYRRGRPALAVEGRTVILVDDGLATGATLRAAIAALRQRHPAQLVVAVPVGAPESVARLRETADDVICLEQPPDFRAVSLAYRDFSATSDTEVVDCLEAARRS